MRWTPFKTSLRPLALAVVALTGASAARAGLFGDEDAQRHSGIGQQHCAGSGHAGCSPQKELSAQIDGLKRSLLDMNSRLNWFAVIWPKSVGKAKCWLAIWRNCSVARKTCNSRWTRACSQAGPNEGEPGRQIVQSRARGKKQFDEALAKLRSQDFAGTAAALNAFLQRYPSTGYKSRRITGWATPITAQRSTTRPLAPSPTGGGGAGSTMCARLKPCCRLPIATAS